MLLERAAWPEFKVFLPVYPAPSGIDRIPKKTFHFFTSILKKILYKLFFSCYTEDVFKAYGLTSQEVFVVFYERQIHCEIFFTPEYDIY